MTSSSGGGGPTATDIIHAAAFYAAKATHGYDLLHTQGGVPVSVMCRCGRSACMVADLLAALVAERERADTAEARVLDLVGASEQITAGAGRKISGLQARVSAAEAALTRIEQLAETMRTSPLEAVRAYGADLAAVLDPKETNHDD